MPNLPGYGSSKGTSRAKAQTFTFVNGYAMEIPTAEKNVCISKSLIELYEILMSTELPISEEKVDSATL